VNSSSNEQRNPYKGSPLRPWLRLQFIAADQSPHEFECVADTGNPFSVILSRAQMALLKRVDGPDASTNFGQLTGGWIRVFMPELGLTGDILAFASDSVVNATQGSHADFQGLVGLPLLRRMVFGGDVNSFWIRPASGNA
jgi:hypothetical protein